MKTKNELPIWSGSTNQWIETMQRDLEWFDDCTLPAREQAEWLLDYFYRLVVNLESEGLASHQIDQLLLPVKQRASLSPFIQRAQHWPRGYPGDFETIQKIIDNRNDAVPGTYGFWLEDYFLSSPICQQHRNKVDHQTKLIYEVAQIRPEAKILSIGCGSSEDLYRCLPLLETTSNHITLVDTDQNALNFSKDRLAPLHPRLSVYKENIIRLERSISGQFDLILIGGVFDYVPDRLVVRVLSILSQMLTPLGTVFFTNIARNNPYRIYMEHLANWKLIERSETDLRNLATAAGIIHHLHVEKDSSTLTYLVSVSR